jgi:hypothetical protein
MSIIQKSWHVKYILRKESVFFGDTYICEKQKECVERVDKTQFLAVNGGVIYKFKVCKSAHHHTIQINHQLDAINSRVYYSDIYLQLNMFWESSRSSSEAQQQK